MIYSITGKIVEKTPSYLILESGGIAYEIRIPLSTYEKLPRKEENCTLFTHLHLNLNQDELKLFGFITLAEKAVFLKLISISGIGPKIALSVISSLSLSFLIKAIQTEEDGVLAKVPGIGKKTAQRIIIELKDDVRKLAQIVSQDEGAVDSSYFEVEQALTALGYNSKDIQKAMSRMSQETKELPIEQQIKHIIKLLYQK